MQQLLRATLSPRLALGLLLVALLAVGYLALNPRPPRSVDLGWDKLNHLCAFGALMLLAGHAWPQRWGRAALGLLAYGGLIELLQTQVPGRSGEWPDLLADGLGLLLGAALLALLARWRRISATRTR